MLLEFSEKIVLQPKRQHQDLATTNARGLFTIAPGTMPTSRQRMLATRRTMHIPPEKPLQILVSNFSDRQACLPKRVTIAQCGTHLDVIHSVDFNDQNVFPIETPEVYISFSSYPADLHSNVVAVHYKPTKGRQL